MKRRVAVIVFHVRFLSDLTAYSLTVYSLTAFSSNNLSSYPW